MYLMIFVLHKHKKRQQEKKILKHKPGVVGKNKLGERQAIKN